ncbi:MAG: agmatine deiminase family protein [Deltaproteobacteria bacterium]|nr:agmatine deiminase family protein [Deltaproteobacteria bacterium]
MRIAGSSLFVLILSVGCGAENIGEIASGPIPGQGEVELLPATMTAGERVGKADGFDPRDNYPEYYGFTAPPSQEVVLPGEFEAAERMLIGWAPSAYQLSDFFAEMVASASEAIPVTVYVQTQAQADAVYSDLAYAGANLDAVNFAGANLDSIWIRDYGPMVVKNEFGPGKLSVDGRYYWGRWQDDYFPTIYAEDYGTGLTRPPLEIEGGNLLADGTGKCVTTEFLLEQNGSAFGYGQSQVAEILDDYYGCDQTTFVPPLYGEGTGHVDILTHVTGPGQILVGQYSNGQDSINAQRLDTAAARLQAAGWQVTRLPMPSNSGRQVWRTYTNGLAVNGAVLVPVYDESSASESQALNIFASAYPGRTIIPVDSDEIIYWSGAIHCVTMTVGQ